MDEAYEMNSKKVKKSALPKSHRRLELMGKPKLEMFDELVCRLDEYIGECLCNFYKDATDSIQQMVSDLDSDGRIRTQFLQGRCTDWQLIFDSLECQYHQILPTSVNPLASLMEQLCQVKVGSSIAANVAAYLELKHARMVQDGVLVVFVIQLECFSRIDFLDCLLDVIAESGNRKVCLVLSAITSVESTSQRISRDCFSQLKISVTHFPSPVLLIERLLQGLVLGENPLHPFSLDGHLLEYLQRQYLRKNHSVNELRKVLLLALLNYCRTSNDTVATKWMKNCAFQSDTPYKIALLILREFEEAVDGDKNSLRDIHCMAISNEFPIYYENLKSGWSRWSKEICKARLRKLEQLLSVDGGPSSELDKCRAILYELDVAKVELKHMPSKSATMKPTELLRAKKERTAENQVTAAQKEKIIQFLDALVLDARDNYVEEHSDFVVRFPEGLGSRGLRCSLATEDGFE